MIEILGRRLDGLEPIEKSRGDGRKYELSSIKVNAILLSDKPKYSGNRIWIKKSAGPTETDDLKSIEKARRDIAGLLVDIKKIRQMQRVKMDNIKKSGTGMDLSVTSENTRGKDGPNPVYFPPENWGKTIHEWGQDDSILEKAGRAKKGEIYKSMGTNGGLWASMSPKEKRDFLLTIPADLAAMMREAGLVKGNRG